MSRKPDGAAGSEKVGVMADETDETPEEGYKPTATDIRVRRKMLTKPVDMKTPRAGGKNINDPVPNRAAATERKVKLLSEVADPSTLVGQGAALPGRSADVYHIDIQDQNGKWRQAHELYSVEQVTSAMKRLQNLPKDRIRVSVNGKPLTAPNKRAKRRKTSLVNPPEGAQ
jgi:hypothetical protein